MARATAILMALFALFLIPNDTLATLVSVDADAYPTGTDISELFPGVTLSTGGPFLNTNRVISYDSRNSTRYTPTTGTQIFGIDRVDINGTQYVNPEFLEYSSYGGPHFLYAEFDEPTDYVSIVYRKTYIFRGTSLGEMIAYDEVGNVIASDETLRLDPNESETLSVSLSGIKKIRVGVKDGETAILDNLQFNLIPEPMSLSLLAIGSIPLQRRRRRGKKGVKGPGGPG